MKLTVHRFPAFVQMPSRQSWGECWWTARDICLTNDPDLSYIEEWLYREIERRIQADFL